MEPLCWLRYSCRNMRDIRRAGFLLWERLRGMSAECKWQRDMDRYFGDEKLAQIDYEYDPAVNRYV